MGLGEPRKRVKYSIDPNALSWANGNNITLRNQPIAKIFFSDMITAEFSIFNSAHAFYFF